MGIGVAVTEIAGQQFWHRVQEPANKFAGQFYKAGWMGVFGFAGNGLALLGCNFGSRCNFGCDGRKVLVDIGFYSSRLQVTNFLNTFFEESALGLFIRFFYRSSRPDLKVDQRKFVTGAKGLTNMPLTCEYGWL